MLIAIAAGNRYFIAFIVRPLADVWLELPEQTQRVDVVVALADGAAAHLHKMLSLAAYREAAPRVVLDAGTKGQVASALRSPGAHTCIRGVERGVGVVGACLAEEGDALGAEPLAEE